MIYTVECSLTSAMQLANHFANPKAVRPHTSCLLKFCRNRGIKMLARITQCSGGSKRNRLSSASYPEPLVFAFIFLSGGPIHNLLQGDSPVILLPFIARWCRFSKSARPHYYCHLQVWSGNTLPGEGTVYHSRRHVEG